MEPEDRNLAIALGGLSKGTSPLKMAQAYTAFVNGGVVSEAHTITKIENKSVGISRCFLFTENTSFHTKSIQDVVYFFHLT